MTDYQFVAMAIVIFGSFAGGWLCRSIVADKQFRELDAIIDGLRMALARRERDGQG